MNNNKYNAFTLAEVLVSLMVIGLISAILIPIIHNSIPKDNRLMLKKVYMVTSKALHKMISDEDKYPDEEKGFASKSGEDFCKNFASYFNKIEDNTSSSCNNGSGTSPSPFMITSDGMKWYFIYGGDDKVNSDDSYGYKIIVDINGKRKPNCQLSTLGHCSSLSVGDHSCAGSLGSGCDDPDTFIISVNRQGKIAAANSGWTHDGTTAEPYDLKILESPASLK